MQNSEPTPASQTIVIERRERAGLFRRIVLPVMMIVLFIMVIGNLFGPSTALPTRLGERYVAGDLTASKVAIVEVIGTILDDDVDHVLQQIRQAREDDNVRAVVLRIDSPGGTVTGADRIWRELVILGERKPIVASMGGIAASGGYYVAAPANTILAEPTTMTGSIGVIMEIPELGGLLEKVGVSFETIKTGQWKDSPSMYHPMSAEERARWDVVIDDSYQRFIRVIAQGRKLPIEDVRSLADGKVFTAREAVERKLVDAEGYLDDAIRVAWKLGKLENARVIRYARPLSFTNALMNLSTPSAAVPKLDGDVLLRIQRPRMLYLAR